MERDPLVILKGMSPDEYAYLRQILTEMNERQSQNFVAFILPVAKILKKFFFSHYLAFWVLPEYSVLLLAI